MTRRGNKARKLLGWPERRKLAHAFLWECSYKRLKLAQLLGQLGVFLTQRRQNFPAVLAEVAASSDVGIEPLCARYLATLGAIGITVRAVAGAVKRH